jgi:hypothetical protein
MEHYATIVDLFGPSGNLHEAEAFIISMPIEPGRSVYKALLSACQVHGNKEIDLLSVKSSLSCAQLIFHQLITLTQPMEQSHMPNRKIFTQHKEIKFSRLIFSHSHAHQFDKCIRPKQLKENINIFTRIPRSQ